MTKKKKKIKILTKLCGSEVRKIKKDNPKLKPHEKEIRNKEAFIKSYFGSEYRNCK